MIGHEQFREKIIHIVHSDMYLRWLNKDLSERDRNNLVYFYTQLAVLEANNIAFKKVDNTQCTYGARSGDSVLVGGAIWGVCPNEHAEYLQSKGIRPVMCEDLSFHGFRDLDE